MHELHSLGCETLSPAGSARGNAPAQVPLEEMFEDLKLDENDEDEGDNDNDANDEGKSLR